VIGELRGELDLLIEDRFPTIWMPSTEQRDLRTLLGACVVASISISCHSRQCNRGVNDTPWTSRPHSRRLPRPLVEGGSSRDKIVPTL
jgi:hypothetical protein